MTTLAKVLVAMAFSFFFEEPIQEEEKQQKDPVTEVEILRGEKNPSACETA